MSRSGEGPGVSAARAGTVLLLGIVGVVGACLLSSSGVEPFATWLYTAAWYPLLVAFEGAVALRHGRFLLLLRPRAALSVLAWSVPGWMLFEVLNLRLENWYYVFVPGERAALWTGVIVSFATVFPACFLPGALFHPRSPGEERGARTVAPSRALRRAARWTGVAFLVLPVLWPRWFFPLVWGAFTLLPESDTARRAPERSLLADAVSGRWRRIVALLAGGAVAGFFWEFLNSVARAGWIYTVPGLEEVKLFEMPPLGFLGFPPLALTCFALYQWLAVRGWAVPAGIVPGGDGTGDPALGGAAEPAGFPGPGLGAAAAGAVLLVVGTLVAMERETISSRAPRLRDLPGLLPAEVQTLAAWGVDSVFELAGSEPGALAARVPGVEEERARAWVETARLATTRGMGTRIARHLHRWGIRSRVELARVDPGELTRCFREHTGVEVRSAQARIWIRAVLRDPATGGAAEGPPLRPACGESG